MIVVLFVKNTKEHPNFSFKVQRADLRYFTAHLIANKIRQEKEEKGITYVFDGELLRGLEQ